MLVSIINVLIIPKLQYLDDMNRNNDLEELVRKELFISLIYLMDLLTLICIYGMKDVVLKKSYAIKVEMAF
jgi:hypothetical protein